MRKKSLKIIMIFLVFIIVEVFSNQIYVFGAGTSGTVSDKTSKLISDMDINKSNQDATKDSRLVAIIAQVFSVIQFIGTGISIIMVMWVGISYMMSSVEQKAELKKRSVPIVIGSVLIVATVNVLKFIQLLVTTSL